MADVINPPAAPTKPQTQAPPPANPPKDAPPAAPASDVAVPDPATQIREQVRGDDKFWKRIMPNLKEPKDDQPAVETGAAPETTKAPETVAEDTQPDKPAPTERRRRPKKDVDPDKMIDAVATAAAKSAAAAVRETRQEPKAPAPSEAPIKLPEEYSKDAAIFEEMARVHPDRYSTLTRDVAAFAQKENDYARKWERQHPGQQFDPESTEHEEFYAEHPEPQFDEDHFRQADRTLLKRETRQEVLGEIAPDLEEFRKSRKEQEIEPVIAQHSVRAVVDILGAIDPELGKLAADPEKLKEIDDTNPDAAAVTLHVTGPLVQQIRETVRLHSGATKFSEANPVHMELFRTARDAERMIADLPVRDRLDDEGRMFASREEYRTMSPTERAKHWILDQDKLLSLLVDRARNDASALYKSRIAGHETYAKRRGYAPNAAVNETQAAQKREPSKAIPAQQQRSAAAPSVTGHTVIGGEASNPNGQVKSGYDTFFDRIMTR